MVNHGTLTIIFGTSVRPFKKKYQRRVSQQVYRKRLGGSNECQSLDPANCNRSPKRPTTRDIAGAGRRADGDSSPILLVRRSTHSCQKNDIFWCMVKVLDL